MLVHSENIKTVLMHYYRFKRQFVCVDEITTDSNENADLLVMTKKHFIEIEIKTSKSDLFSGEARKEKHKKENERRFINKYFICVPTELIEDAKVWVEQTNKKYGIIEFKSALADRASYYSDLIHFVKNADVIQKNYFSPILKERIVYRLNSALINERTRRIN